MNKRPNDVALERLRYMDDYGIITLKLQSFFYFCPVTVTVPIPFVGKHSSPLSIVPQRDIPLLQRYFNVTPTKLYELLNEKYFS
jgi:hypothetical protein